MGQRSKPTYWSISRKLRLPPTVVKRELDSLEKGLVKGLRVIPDVNFFALVRTEVYARLDGKVRDAIQDRLRLLDFVETAYVAQPLVTEGALSKFDRPTDVYFAKFDLVYAPDGSLGNRLELMKAVFGDFEVMYTSDFQTIPRKASPSTVFVLRGLAARPMEDIGAMAERLSMTPKTVSRHLSLLRETKAFHYEPVLSTSGSDLYVFVVTVQTEDGDGEAVSRKLKEKLEEYWLLGNIGSSGSASIICLAGNFGQVMEAFARVRAEAELKGASLLLGLEEYDNQPNVFYMQEYPAESRRSYHR